jgi:uncharacterized protein (TIGR02453 family)
MNKILEAADMSFGGFTSETLRFLFENKVNDSKAWYEEHKSQYKEYVYNPFEELVIELAPAITEIDSNLITIPSKIISRIRRDTRFTKDKSLYRDNVWIAFLRDKSQMSTSPCFWFEINQKGSSYGIGYYGATTASMNKMRKMIIDRHPSFLEALKCYESQNEFSIGGEMYKRSKFPAQPENLRLWLDRKNIFFECAQNGYKLGFSKELPAILKKGYNTLKPIYDFLCLVEY